MQLPQKPLFPRPQLTRSHFTPRMPGPCFNCFEMGHLKANCPKLARTYPFVRSVNVCVVNNMCDLSRKGDLITGSSVWFPIHSDHLEHKLVFPQSSMGDLSSVRSPKSSDLLQHNEPVIPQCREEVSSQATNCPINLPHLEQCDSISSIKCVPTGSPQEGDRDIPGDIHDFGQIGNDPSLGRFWEAEMGGNQVIDVQGRLKASLQFWEHELKPAPWIIDCIKTGYKLPLKSIFNSYCRPNQKSAIESKEFVSQALRDLETNRCIEPVPQRPHICSPLSVVCNSSGKQRLVINLRYLNQFLWRDKFKYEDLRIAMLLFQKGDYLYSFDLTLGYHHVDIYEPHQRYLGFQWEKDDTVNFYVFKVLSFGLATACYAFTKLLRPLVKCWRSQGLRVVLYLDDGIVAISGEAATGRASIKVRSDLAKAGLVKHTAKSHWTPSQQATWLGFNLDLKAGMVYIPQEKIISLKTQLQYVSQGKAVMARMLASVIGKIISMSLALGPVARLMTRSMYAVLNTRMFWCQLLEISQEARYELRFWLSQIDSLNGSGVWQSPSAVRVVYTDASGTGYAGYTVEHGCHIALGLWAKEESSASSTWRELRAVRMVLESLIGKLHDHRVRWFTDNQNVVKIISNGSKNPSLQKETLAIFSFSMANSVHIDPEWIPRSENQKADFLSKLTDQDDWSIPPEVFRQLDTLWGPHTIDRFANFCNTQLPRFNSHFWNPGTEAVDAFTCDWGDDVNWLCPPPYLIPRTICHALQTHACDTLIVPEWPSAPYWPMLFPDGHQ